MCPGVTLDSIAYPWAKFLMSGNFFFQKCLIVNMFFGEVIFSTLEKFGHSLYDTKPAWFDFRLWVGHVAKFVEWSSNQHMDCLTVYEAEENNLHSAVPSSVPSSCQGLALPFLLGRSPIILNDMSCLLSEDLGSMLLMIATSSQMICFLSYCFSENIA